MRLLMFEADGGPRLGVLAENGVIDVPSVAREHGTAMRETNILEGLSAGNSWMTRLRTLLDSVDHEKHIHSLDALRVLAPLDPPAGNILAIGRNYSEHAGEMSRARGEEIERPTVFTKAQTTVNGPFSEIIIPEASSQIDWEAELGVVIGTRALNVKRDEALDYVFGYTVINDVSARDVQYGWGGQFFKGKSFDSFCPMGPWIVTSDEVPDPQNLEVTLRVNGEIKQQGNTASMIFPVAELIAQLSDGMSLPAGTVIATGTPPGVGYALEPKEFLQPGDVMETAIQSLGTLRNTVR